MVNDRACLSMATHTRNPDKEELQYPNEARSAGLLRAFACIQRLCSQKTAHLATVVVRNQLSVP